MLWAQMHEGQTDWMSEDRLRYRPGRRFPATALVGLSFELDGQMAAPDFDAELNLHRAQHHPALPNAYGSLGWKGAEDLP